MNPTRRKFIQSAAAVSAALGAPLILGAQQNGNRRFKTALIGTGWWGKNILAEAIASKRCDVTALCDVDGGILEQAQDQVNDLTGSSPKTYKDFRDLLDKGKPDIAIIATPDHWHALQSIAALRAGAHVYVEKPTGHTINESRAVVNTARRTGKVVQVGLHRRLGPHHVSARKFFLDGNVGGLGMARCFVDSAGGKENPSENT
jgi:predicted dehydrogenase